MADSILAQVTMAGGAINFILNEILYSKCGTVSSSSSSDSRAMISHGTIDAYDYDYLLITHAANYNSVLLPKSAYMKIRNNNLAVGLGGSNVVMYQINGNNSSYDYIWYGTILYLVK